MTRAKASGEPEKPVGLRALLWALLNEARNHLVVFHDNHRRHETVVAMSGAQKRMLIAALEEILESEIGAEPWGEDELIERLRILQVRWPKNLAIVHCGGSGLSVKRQPSPDPGTDVASWPEVCRLNIPGNSCA